MFVTEYVPFQLKLNPLHRLAAVVGDMDIDVKTGAADPDLSMQTSSDSDNFHRGIAELGPLV